jgi:hypothetical protein
MLRLRRVALFHPDVVSKELPAKFCICRKGERLMGRRTKMMTTCDECLEWYHNDCAGLSDEPLGENEPWTCEFCLNDVDHLGYQRWFSGRRKPKKRHVLDTPRAKRDRNDPEALVEFSSPRTWDGKERETKERSRRAGIKKRKLQEAAASLIDGKSHHLTDAEGLAGLEQRAVDDGVVDEMLDQELIQDDSSSDNRSSLA